MNFEDVYAGYVIRYVGDGGLFGYFVGPPSSEMYRVALKQHAARFTKEQAMKYIEENEGKWLIEDAT